LTQTQLSHFYRNFSSFLLPGLFLPQGHKEHKDYTKLFVQPLCPLCLCGKKNKIIAVFLRRRKITTVAFCDMILIKTLYIKHINPVRLKSSEIAGQASGSGWLNRSVHGG
jgi:hypothetical protein